MQFLMIIILLLAQDQASLCKLPFMLFLRLINLNQPV
ncbi:hypothetical protein MTR67_002587 [Solanum verrucosum]|uniref:Uncharacterized protein n=1 Tax=Solanum verrucosum TaxID=315347 RepID=A0AAF0T621_SOLVR|nr:hypothetical protein MTR67_002587 [Solanum verrucosum]